MIGAFLFCGMGLCTSIAIGATRMGKDAECRDREVLARKRVETILEEGECDYRCKGCPVELLCQKRIDRMMTVNDCCKLWLQQRGYEPKEFKAREVNLNGSEERA